MVRRTAAIAFALLSPLLLGADGDYVRFVLDQPSITPYSTIRYEVIQRGRATTAVHRRGLPGYEESLHGMGLLTTGEAADLWTVLSEVDAGALPDALGTSQGARSQAGVTWQVDVSLGGAQSRFRVFEPENQSDRRYARLFRAVCRVVEDHAGRHPFRNVFLAKRRRGWLNLVSVPVARVTIDGFDTGLETPLYGYEVEKGKRQVALVSRDGIHERTYEIRIESGTTTHVRADIR
jgi:hypothetical protein